MGPTTTETTSVEPPDAPETPRSARAPQPTALERLLLLEGWVKDVDALVRASDAKRNEQHSAQMGALQNVANQVAALTTIVSGLGGQVKATQEDIGRIAAELGTRAKQDSVHEERLSQHEAQLEETTAEVTQTKAEVSVVKSRLTARNVLIAVAGVGGFGGVWEGGKALLKLLFGHH